jgi:dTDP-4-amino-4,6-dideoxygalactose transaminase
MSTQNNKLINSGEGGFIITDNDDIMAYSMISSGCYENYHLKHKKMCPPEHKILKYKNKIPNLSLRMTNIQGAMIYPQILNIEKTIDIVNERYYKLVNLLENNKNIKIINTSDEKLDKILMSLQKYCKINRFTDIDNARNYKNWRFINNTNKYPSCDININNVFDMRITDDDIQLLGINMLSTFSS